MPPSVLLFSCTLIMMACVSNHTTQGRQDKPYQHKLQKAKNKVNHGNRHNLHLPNPFYRQPVEFPTVTPPLPVWPPRGEMPLTEPHHMDGVSILPVVEDLISSGVLLGFLPPTFSVDFLAFLLSEN